MDVDRLIREVLSRRDPQGYYVIPADRRAVDDVRKHFTHGLRIEEAGDVVLIRVTSRSLAEKITKFLASKGLLRPPYR